MRCRANFWTSISYACVPANIHYHALQMRAEQIKVGGPFDVTSRLGPLINKQQYDKVLGYIEVLSPVVLLPASADVSC